MTINGVVIITYNKGLQEMRTKRNEKYFCKRETKRNETIFKEKKLKRKNNSVARKKNVLRIHKNLNFRNKYEKYFQFHIKTPNSSHDSRLNFRPHKVYFYKIIDRWIGFMKTNPS
jgi:hypothetical protein